MVHDQDGKLSDSIKKEFNETYGNECELTSKITFSRKEKGINIHINNPYDNMQDDSAAFDAWALALFFSGYRNLSLTWNTKPLTDQKKRNHYNRFLYRVDKFRKSYTWLKGQDTFTDVQNEKQLVINFGKKAATDKNDDSEVAYESLLFNSMSFRNEFNVETGKITRQFPVGIFQEDVSSKSTLFPRGNSAIDIIGINKNNQALVFELKIGDNRKVGAISETLFYMWIIDDIRTGRIKSLDESKTIRDTQMTMLDIAETNITKGYIISKGKCHPIVKGIIDNPGFNLDIEYIENFTV